MMDFNDYSFVKGIVTKNNNKDAQKYTVSQAILYLKVINFS
jgi:hypothetical protein